MPNPMDLVKNLLLVLTLLIGALASVPLRAETSSVQVAWRLLDYIAVDYSEAVQDGRVISPSEFAEMTEFAATAHQRIDALPASDSKRHLQRAAAALQDLIGAKAPPAAVTAAARSLAADLIRAFPVPITPAKPLDFDRGRKLFARSCASCHGTDGDGRGPASTGLHPSPIAFIDRKRARERSVFALKQVIDQGIAGTSMASFATLPSQDRWDLALYSSSFAYPASLATEGERIWKNDPALRSRIDLKSLVTTTSASLAETLGARKADAVTAYLRRNPAALLSSAASSLALARTRLEEAVEAYANGDHQHAADLALSAYLDGFEPVEPVVSAQDRTLMIKIEAAMGALRSAVADGQSLDEVRAQVATLDILFTGAESMLSAGESAPVSTFLGAFTILLREGLEALLIVVAMLAFLRRTHRNGGLAYVHAGWIAALGGGVLTWVAATHLIDISGASREMTEGFGSVLAAGVLLWVGIWMHGKSSLKAWQHYIHGQLAHALTGRSFWLLFGLSFLVVYREAFETILFCAAIWHHGNGGIVLAGGLTAIATLLAIAWAMLRYSKALPIERFFAYTSGLIALLAVVLLGKGVNALQEAGQLPIHPLANFPRVVLLGLFPTREGVAASLGMIIVLTIGFTLSHIRAKRKHRQNA